MFCYRCHQFEAVRMSPSLFTIILYHGYMDLSSTFSKKNKFFAMIQRYCIHRRTFANNRFAPKMFYFN